MISQVITNAIEETINHPVVPKSASCSWFDEDDEEESDMEDDGEPMVATMRKRLLSQASVATLDTLGMTESSWELSDDEESFKRRCVSFSDTLQIFEIESENEDHREELFYSSNEIQKFREDYDQELFECGSFTM